MKRIIAIIVVLAIICFVTGYISKECFDCRLLETRPANKLIEPKQPANVEYEAFTFDCQNSVCLFKREIQIE